MTMAKSLFPGYKQETVTFDILKMNMTESMYAKINI